MRDAHQNLRIRTLRAIQLTGKAREPRLRVQEGAYPDIPVIWAAAFRATGNQPAPDKFVLMSITTVDYEDIGDNYTLSQLSRGQCQNARINLGPLWGGKRPADGSGRWK